MIVQAIGLLDDLDKELNTYAMRVREWYGWHFPEMTKIVADNVMYAKTVGTHMEDMVHKWWNASPEPGQGSMAACWRQCLLRVC